MRSLWPALQQVPRAWAMILGEECQAVGDYLESSEDVDYKDVNYLTFQERVLKRDRERGRTV